MLLARKRLRLRERRARAPAIAEHRRRNRDAEEGIDAIGHHLRGARRTRCARFHIAHAQRRERVVQQVLFFVRRACERARKRGDRLAIERSGIRRIAFGGHCRDRAFAPCRLGGDLGARCARGKTRFQIVHHRERRARVRLPERVDRGTRGRRSRRRRRNRAARRSHRRGQRRAAAQIDDVGASPSGAKSATARAGSLRTIAPRASMMRTTPMRSSPVLSATANGQSPAIRCGSECGDASEP